MLKVLIEICKIFEIIKLKMLSYRFQINVVVERVNGFILIKFRIYIDVE